MKKVFLYILFNLLLASVYANAVTDLAKQASNTITTVVDSTKSAVVSTVETVDSSSNFKMIYSDLRDGIVALGQSLKVGAEHVYMVLVKQQVVNSITGLIYIILLIPLGIFIYRSGVKLTNYCDDDNPAPIFYWVFIGIGYIVLVGIAVFQMNNIVMGFLNPEYGAIKDVINFVQTAGDKTCQTCK